MAARIPSRKSETGLNLLSLGGAGAASSTQVNEDEARRSWRKSGPGLSPLSPHPPVDYTAPLAEPRMPKPTSMVSLRDRALALLDKDRRTASTLPRIPRSSSTGGLRKYSHTHSHGHLPPIHVLDEDDVDEEGRPHTPGSMLFGRKERKGLFKLFKR
jgi:hypothetical protein